MNLTLHHLRKDIRAQRWLILLWVLVAVALGLPELLIFQPDYDAARLADSFRNSPLNILLGVIAWTLLVARLVQSEPITGSTSFWLTRPIPRSVSVGSRLLFLVLFALLPGFVPALTHSFAFHADAHTFWTQIGAAILLQFIAAICVIWLATYTPSLIHFAGMLCLAAVTLIFAQIVRVQIQEHLLGHHQLDATFVFFNVIVIGFFISLVVEYSWRRSRAGFFIGIAAIILGLLYQIAAPATPYFHTGDDFDAKLITTIDFAPGWASQVFWGRFGTGDGSTAPEALSTIQPTGDAAGSRVWIQSVSASFEVPGGFSGFLPATGESYFYLSEISSDTLDLLQAKLPGITIALDRNLPKTSHAQPLFYLTPEVDKRVNGQTGKLTLDLKGQVLALNQLAAIPLDNPRYFARFPNGLLRVVPVRPGSPPGQLTIWSLMPQRFFYTTQAQYICVLVDPATSTGQVLKSNGYSSTTSDSLLTMGSERTLVDADVGYAIPAGEAIEHRVLYVFQYAPEARFESTLTEPNFKMAPTTDSE